MRQIIATAAAALAAVTAVPAMARDTAPSSSATPTAATPAPNAKTRYCVKDTTTGSRLPKKTCKTRADWIADDNFDPLAPQR